MRTIRASNAPVPISLRLTTVSFRPEALVATVYFGFQPTVIPDRNYAALAFDLKSQERVVRAGRNTSWSLGANCRSLNRSVSCPIHVVDSKDGEQYERR